MAVGVCHADDSLNDAEQKFLGDLQRQLGVGDAEAAPLRAQADQLTAAAIPPQLGSALDASGGTPAPAAPRDAELESTILNHSILAGALQRWPGCMAARRA